MADTMQFDLVAPERNLLSVAVREIRLPGEDGDLTAMPGHAPTIVNLRPGIVKVIDGQGGESEFAISGGFAEISGDSVSLLAEIGHKREDMTQAAFDQMLRTAYRKKDAAESVEGLGQEAVAATVKLLSDMQALGTHIGLDPNSSTVPD